MFESIDVKADDGVVATIDDGDSDDVGKEEIAGADATPTRGDARNASSPPPPPSNCPPAAADDVGVLDCCCFGGNSTSDMNEYSIGSSGRGGERLPPPTPPTPPPPPIPLPEPAGRAMRERGLNPCGMKS